MRGTHREVLSEVVQLPIIDRVLSKLAHDLSPDLRYHSVLHTKDVLSEVVLFALHDDLSKRDVELLSVAASYHDAGYLERYKDNEVIGASMAAEAMRSANYSAPEILEVEQMILSTKLVETPEATVRVQHTPLSGYLLDADLGSFGREDFFEKCQLLIEETGSNPDTFYRLSLNLITNHTWFTPAARTLRDGKRSDNIKALQGKLKQNS